MNLSNPEFEMQYDELLRAEAESDRSAEKYKELFDFAPSGYFVLSGSGEIIDLNLCGSQMLGFEKADLINKVFADFVADHSKYLFIQYLEKIFNTLSKESCEILLSSSCGISTDVLLTGIRAPEKDYCLLTATDITERKKTEAELLRSKELYADMISNQSVGVFRILVQNQKRSIVESISMEYVSDRFCTLLDFDPLVPLEEITDLVFKKIHPNDLSSFINSHETALNSSAPYTWEGRFIVKNEIKWIKFESSPRNLGEGRTRWTGVAINITKRKLTQEELHLANVRLRHLFDSDIIGVVVANIDGGVLEANDYYLNVIGYSRAEFENGDVNWRSITPPEWLPADEFSIHQIIDNKPSNPYVKEYLRRDGTRVTVLIADTMLPGTPEHIAGFVVDITERKLAEEAVLESESRLKKTQEIAHLGSWELDIESGQLIWSDEVYRIFGMVPGEILINHTTFMEFVHPEDREILNDAYFSSVVQDQEGYEIEHRIIRRHSGEVRYLLEKCKHIRNASGKIIRSAGMVQDITNRKKIELEINSKNAELQKLNAEKDKYFSIIAHDLRNPFSGFLGLTELMADGLQRMTLDDIQKIAVLMKDSATNLFRLLSNLLEWSRMQRGLTKFIPTHIRLLTKLSESLVLVREEANKKEVTIDITISSQLYVFADVNMLEGILRNLVSNAVKFTPRGGVVKISATQLPDHLVEIIVQDSGIGMKKSMIENLFRLDVNTNRKGTDGELSTGLGLMICRDFIEKHGGKLQIESKVGKGSIFRFRLPG